ncbi:MAG: hypothetical protein RLZZ205_618 [Bacteroidota bacterium]|jgi:cob(I)alamin adenosyltransferase
MKIYTKTGDQGTTGILGSERLDKFNIRIEAYGNVDELNAQIGVLNAQYVDDNGDWIQDRLFVLGSWLAVEPGLESQIQMPKIELADIKRLEKAMDTMDAELPPLQNFILPGGHLASAQAHVARCICRRAERSVWELNHEHPVQMEIPVFLNRLSDYYFTLSRWILLKNGLTPQCWIPKK